MFAAAFVGGDRRQCGTGRHGQREHLDRPVLSGGAADLGTENPYVKIRDVAAVAHGEAFADDDAGLRGRVGGQGARRQFPAQRVLVGREHQDGGVREAALVGQRPQFGAAEAGQHPGEQVAGVLFAHERGRRAQPPHVVDGGRRHRGRGHGEGRF